MKDVCKDGCICKKILKETEGYDCPKDGAVVKVKLVRELQDETVFVRKGHGDGDKLFEFKAEEEQSLDSALIFTPPVSQPSNRHAHASVRMPINALRRLDEALASEVESLSISRVESMQNVMDLLADLLQAIDPKNCMAVKDEVIVDLAD
ncbi:hypothetical protein Nepgr_024185 [Nepenthes gracilis]|uniref:Uncharacterized protein n=1 Tax=Nepenthes gracilis TaxID=150966 RepID=A0AAD3T463_NEPGR|nr:hypothetical protein Nepgr_024185 [Nepenthes gracilis]